MSRLRLLVASLAWGVVACAGSAPEPVLLSHPKAHSSSLGVRDNQYAATFQENAFDEASEREDLAGAVVRIVVTHLEGVAMGSGVAFCQEGSRAYILSAQHVLTGVAGTASASDPFEVESIAVEFYRNGLPPVQAPLEELFVRHVPGRDLSLLRVELPYASARLPRVRIGRADRLGRGSEVRTVGYSKDAQLEWRPQHGTVRGFGEFLEYGPKVSQGYSGAPVVDAEDRLVGLNTRTSRDGVSVAIPIEDALAEVRRWVPPVCPQATG